MDKGTYTVKYNSSTRRPKGFDSENLPFFHLRLILRLHEWNGLPGVDVIRLDVVAGDVSHRLHGERFAVDLYLVALHHLLDCSTDVADTDVNSGILIPLVTRRRHGLNQPHLDTSVGRVLHCSEQIVIGWIE